MALKLYLDDMREAPEGWLAFKPEHLSLFMHLARHADFISFDHDLGLDPDGKEYLSGYDVLTRLEKMALEKLIWSAGAPEMYVHSANPVGAERMRQVINNIIKNCGNKFDA